MNHLFRVTNALRLRGITPKISRYLSTQNNATIPVPPPLLTHAAIIKNPWIWKQNDHINCPLIYQNKIELPNELHWIPPLIERPTIEKVIEAPSIDECNIPKQAARLIVIRRKKMKKHKLKKLRKRMKFEWAKLRQRREMKKEKAFQAELIQQCKEAEAFSAEEYVQERINKLNEIKVPKYSGRKMSPESVVKEQMVTDRHQRNNLW